MRTDATHVLARIRKLNRLTLVGETLRYALNELAKVAPDWLRRQVDATWYERYGRRVEDYRLPSAETEPDALGQSIGEEGLVLLTKVVSSDVPAAWRHLPAVEVLQQVWNQQYDLMEKYIRLRIIDSHSVV